MNGHLSRIDDGPNAGDAIRDINELRALDLELGHIRDRIEDRAVKLAASSEERLRHAREEADSAHASAERVRHPRSDLLAQMSHELRTPLNVIIGFTEMMRQAMHGPLGSPRYAEYLDHVRQSAERLLDLTTDVLDLCRFGMERHGLDEEKLDLTRILAQAIRMASYSVDSGYGTIVIHPVELPAIRADGTILTHAVSKVLAFLIKLPGAPGPIEVSGGRDGIGEIVLAIKARGINANSLEIARLIDSFDRGGNVYCWGHSGPGLSLSIAKALIELHRGQISLSAIAAGGLMVTIHLPRMCMVTAEVAD